MSFGSAAPAAPPPPIRPPNAPTRASFVSRGGTRAGQLTPGTARRKINPITGANRSRIGRPSLLGGA